MKNIRIVATSLVVGVAAAAALSGCSSAVTTQEAQAENFLQVEAAAAQENPAVGGDASAQGTAQGQALATVSETAASETTAPAAPAAEADQAQAYTAPTGLLAGQELFTARDLEQVADTSQAAHVSLADGQTVSITEEGVYVVSGTASEACVVVDAGEGKVQIVLDGVSVTNSGTPAIYVRSADKVFVTLQGDNALAVTGAFVPDGETNLDAAVFSKDDLVLNGDGTLSIESTGNGVSCKDDLKVTGGSYVVNAAGHAFEANDSVRVYDGAFAVSAGKDGFHADNDEDAALGYVYVRGGTFAISAGSDGIHATAFVQIDGGTLDIGSSEGIEGTYVQINGGTVNVGASDDGINATSMSGAYETAIEINGGDVSVSMAAGDTDALDSNGSIYVRGGTVSINGQFAFDFDYLGEYTGGTVYVNGEQVASIENSMMMGGMGGPGMGGMGGRGMGW